MIIFMYIILSYAYVYVSKKILSKKKKKGSNVLIFFLIFSFDAFFYLFHIYIFILFSQVVCLCVRTIFLLPCVCMFVSQKKKKVA